MLWSFKSLWSQIWGDYITIIIPWRADHYMLLKLNRGSESQGGGLGQLGPWGPANTQVKGRKNQSNGLRSKGWQERRTAGTVLEAAVALEPFLVRSQETSHRIYLIKHRIAQPQISTVEHNLFGRQRKEMSK
jgi:hypothetical protein